jgi:hypothetical protein
VPGTIIMTITKWIVFPQIFKTIKIISQ